MILSNDRYKWHKHYVATSGGQHEDCPDEAFATLRQFWESPEGKAKSQTMKGIRAKVGKDLSFCSEQDLEVTPTRTRPSLSASEDFHSPGSEQVKFANAYDTPMCSDWVMEAPTEYEATETFASQAHSPEVGTRSCNQYKTPEKVTDAWKEGMESRMDFLQTNLTELIHLLKQGVSSENRQPASALPNVLDAQRTTVFPENIHLRTGTPSPPVSHCIDRTETENTPPSGGSLEDVDRQHSVYPESQSPCSGDTILLSPICCTQAEISNSGSSPPLTSPTNSRSTIGPGDAVAHTVSEVQIPTAEVCQTRTTAPPSGIGLPDIGIVTRGVRGRKSGVCSKIPPDFQPAKDSDTLVPAKKSIWIIHPQHGEIVVAAGRTGPGPRSKVMKEGPPCPTGAQWIYVLRVFKTAVGVMHPSPGDERRTLDCALPPKRGRHELLLWNSRFLIPYKVDESTCTSS
ncbi:hypothetical protein KC19_4G077300 [Ceratodon purpureus]|uniref:Uncharacterized protein n=1 Tax=Ceratodon purpureus TaxID=3225 RepID=A0A8T0I7Y9_CERPU|nr:hypothetical protein KC19_4G077300 [Ceratodon purpureus]